MKTPKTKSDNNTTRAGMHLHETWTINVIEPKKGIVLSAYFSDEHGPHKIDPNKKRQAIDAALAAIKATLPKHNVSLEHNEYWHPNNEDAE